MKEASSNEFEIIPFIGVGNPRFGMTPEEAANILGAPSHVRDHDGRRVEFRFGHHDLVISYDKDGAIFHFGFGRRDMKYLSFKGIKFFQDPEFDVLAALMNEDDSPYESVGIVAFPKLGLWLTGFHDEDIDEKAVSIFRKGHLDEFRNAKYAKPFDLRKAMDDSRREN
jgi:hypothetical protein